MSTDKPDLVLHIGTEKIGSTTIQNFLKANRNKSMQQGIYISEDLMIPSGNQCWLAALAYNSARIDELISDQGYRSKAERDQDMVDRYERFKQEIEASASNCNRWIISSEHLQSRLTTDEEISRLHQLLRGLFKEIIVVLYIRNPVDTAISLLSMFCVHGDVIEELPEPSQPHVELICNHAKILGQWQRNFPKTKIKLRLFEKDRLNQGGLLKGFCNQAHIKPGTDWSLQAQHSNERLTLRGMRYLHHLNSRFPPLVNGKKILSGETWPLTSILSQSSQSLFKSPWNSNKPMRSTTQSPTRRYGVSTSQIKPPFGTTKRGNMHIQPSNSRRLTAST